MTIHTWLSRTLLAGVAVAATAAVAQADEISTLKAQIDSLQNDINSLQATQATALPAGSRFITMSRGSDDGENLGYTFGIMPTADAPAPVTQIQITNELRALVTDQMVSYDNHSGSDTTTYNITERDRLKIVGKTETSVGMVSAVVRLEATDGADFKANLAYGTWKMNDLFTLEGGRDDSIATILAGVDNKFVGGVFAKAGGPGKKRTDQFRLTYADGGAITWGVAIENPIAGRSDNNVPAIGTSFVYDFGNKTTANIVALVSQDNSSATSNTDYWFGAGANVPVASFVTVTAAAGKGAGYTNALDAVSLSSSTAGADRQFMLASAGLMFTLAEGVALDVGYGYAKIDNVTDNSKQNVARNISTELLWTPVKQLTLGVGGGYETLDYALNNGSKNTLQVAAGAWFRF